MAANGLDHHYLRPLIRPRSVAIVGASARPGSLGRVVLENALATPFDGELRAVNPGHAEVLGQTAWSSVAAIGTPIDLAVIATPPRVVLDAIDDAATAGVRCAIVASDAPGTDANARSAWIAALHERAAQRRMRIVGPGAFGIVRADIGLNASTIGVPVRRGGLALIAQSGAVCTAMIDFAAPLGIGFSSVMSIGLDGDVPFGELLDALVVDTQTDGILLYVEAIDDARRFVSALRAAARTKPVVVLKAGRSTEQGWQGPGPAPDAAFDACVRRAGSVRVHTYTQLFAAARILAQARIPRGDRVAIVANGRGPALLAADSAVQRGVRLATLDEATLRALADADGLGVNPIEVRADAPGENLGAAVSALLHDANVDAVIVLHVPRPAVGATDVARAVASAARGAAKPVLGAWLGALDRPEAREALEAGGIANFYTPENAAEAFSFLVAYRRHQQLLLEVPPSSEEPDAPDVATAETIRASAQNEARTTLSDTQAAMLCAAFGIDTASSGVATSLDEAKQLARRFGYPVSLAVAHARWHDTPLRRELLRSGRALARAWEDLVVRQREQDIAALAILVRREPHDPRAIAFTLGAYTDATIGPVLAFGGSRRAPLACGERALTLPPVNRQLAGQLVDENGPLPLRPPVREALITLVVQLSTLVCTLPWVVRIELDPLHAGDDGVQVGSIAVEVDHARASWPRYAHLAIHPYPTELVARAHARNGAPVTIRPIRPEDATLEQRFVTSLSDETRYFRFFYRLHELTPAMLARFTQVDYDRELALVAVVADAAVPERVAFAGVARFAVNPDGETAEYAVVVHDAWQSQGIGRLLMERLIDAARRKGLAELRGAVLRENARMIGFVRALGFRVDDDPEGPEQVNTVLVLDSKRDEASGEAR
jgi:acetyltransferase